MLASQGKSVMLSNHHEEVMAGLTKSDDSQDSQGSDTDSPKVITYTDVSPSLLSQSQKQKQTIANN